jgi:general secretion pathway protein C
MDTANLRALEQTARYGPPTANLILAILIGIALAHFVWLLVPEPAGSRKIRPPPPQTEAQSRQSSGPDIAAITEAHLFGIPPSNAKAKPISAPETHLDLTLDGILAWNVPDRSRALIRGSDNKEKLYAVGDKVPGGAKISDIYSNRVILRRGGGYETLRLKRKGIKLAQTQNSTPGNMSAAIRQHDYGAIRNQIMQNPDKITQIMRLQPVYNNGDLQGYRVYPGSKRKLFQSLGLKPGDIVTSVNGINLNNPGKELSLLGQLSQANQLNVTVKRHGNTQNLTLSLQ